MRSAALGVLIMTDDTFELIYRSPENAARRPKSLYMTALAAERSAAARQVAQPAQPLPAGSRLPHQRPRLPSGTELRRKPLDDKGPVHWAGLYRHPATSGAPAAHR